MPQLGDPSEPRSAPQTVEPAVLGPPTPHPIVPRAAPEPPHNLLSPIRDKRYYGEPGGRPRYSTFSTESAKNQKAFGYRGTGRSCRAGLRAALYSARTAK